MPQCGAQQCTVQDLVAPQQVSNSAEDGLAEFLHLLRSSQAACSSTACLAATDDAFMVSFDDTDEYLTPDALIRDATVTHCQGGSPTCKLTASAQLAYLDANAGICAL